MAESFHPAKSFEPQRKDDELFDPLIPIESPTDMDNAFVPPSHERKLIDPFIYDDSPTDTDNTFVQPSHERELIDPFIYDDSPTDTDNASVSASRGESTQAFPWPRNMVKPADEGKCEADFSLIITSPQEPQIEANVPCGEVAFVPKPSEPPQGVLRGAESTELEPSYLLEQKPSAYSTAEKLIKQVPLLTIDSNLYIHNGSYYQRLSPKDAHKLIMDRCRRDTERVGTPSHLRAVYDFLLVEPKLEYRLSDINRQAVSFLNGVLLLDTGELRPSSPLIVTTYGLQCCYLGGSPATPNFDAFLAQITGGDMELTERIWQMIGYIITPDTSGKVFFLMQGVPNSGKSILSALISSLFNVDAVSALDVHALSEKFAVSELQGKALCISPDLSSGPLDTKSVSKLKQLTGNDVVSADIKYKARVQFLCQAKILLATNHPLLIRERDDAFVERVVVIPFNYTTPKEQQNRHLLELLQLERDAIATRAIAAYYRLVSQKYRFCGHYELNGSSVLDSRADGAGADLMTAVYSFLRSCFVQDANAGVFTDDAHALFVARYGKVHINAFSHHFAEFAFQLYGAEKDRKRKPGGENALSYIAGMRYTAGNGI